MIKRYSWISSFLAIMALIASCSGPASNEEVLQEYIRLHNAQKVDEVMALFHDDAKLILPGQPPIRDIRKVEAWDAAIKSVKKIDSYKVNGDTIVLGGVTEVNNWFTNGGIRQIRYEPGAMFIFNDGKISEIRNSEMTASSQQQVQEMFNNFLTWAYANRYAEISQLMPQGQVTFDESNSKEWFLLLDEWQRSK